MKTIFESDTHKDEVHSGATIGSVIRQITTRAFMQRFTMAERIAIRASTDDVVIDVHEDLKLASFVDLDSTDVIGAIDYFISQSLLESGRKSELLDNGSQSEAL